MLLTEYKEAKQTEQFNQEGRAEGKGIGYRTPGTDAQESSPVLSILKAL